MGRPSLWISIRDTLSSELEAGRYQAGDQLPTESQLATRFGVNRHTVRRAIGAMVDSGLLYTRRGAGVFVAHVQTDYPIGKRVRFHQNVLATGRTPKRVATLMESRLADEDEADALNLNVAAPVHVSEGISFVDDMPMAVYQSVFPARRLPGVLDNLRQKQSNTYAFEQAGVDDYTRAWTRIDALIATPVMAAQLQVDPGAALLLCVGVNVDEEGTPIELGRTWFAADRVTLTLGQNTAGQGAELPEQFVRTTG